jgi:hypothetical protein
VSARYGKRHGPVIDVEIGPDTVRGDNADPAHAEMVTQVHALAAGTRLGAIADYRIALFDRDDLETKAGRVHGYELVAAKKLTKSLVVSVAFVYVLGPSIVRVQADVPAPAWRSGHIPSFAHALIRRLAVSSITSDSLAPATVRGIRPAYRSTTRWTAR